MLKLLRRAAPLLAALIVLSPLVHDPNHDSYPLSTYPMFADDRASLVTIDAVVTVDPDGNVTHLSATTVSGTDEVVTASVVVDKAIARGHAQVLCEEVAEVIDDPSLTVEVRSETVDTVALVDHGAPPVRIEVWASCRSAP